MVGDASGNGRTGAFSATLPPTWSNGKLGKSLYFNGSVPGSNNKVTFSGINVTNTHTVSMWIYISANCASWGNLFASNGGNGVYCLSGGGGNGTGNKIDYYFSGDHLSNTPIPLNQWHHIAVSNNAGTATFYLDGVADGTVSAAPAYTATNIGNDSLEDTLNGNVDDLRVYSRVFSAAEVLALYKSGAVKIGLSNPSPGTLADGLKSYWTFDGKDIVSNIADMSGNGSNGTLLSFASTTTVPGKIGQALTFDGVDDAVRVPLASSYKPGSGDFSVSLWYKGNSGTFISAGGCVAASKPCWGIYNTAASFSMDAFPIVTALATYTLPSDNEWHHLVVVLNRAPSPDTISAYLDGQPLSVTYTWQTLDGHNVTPTNGNMFIGGNLGYEDIMHEGPIDEMRLYNRALSTGEITQLYNLGAGQKVSKTKTPVGTLADGLKGWWTFDGGDTNWATNTVTDKSGNGNTGTLVNMSTSTSPVAGKIGQGLNFVAASTQRVALGTSSTLQPGTGVSFSVSLWYKGLKGTTESFVSSGPTCCNYWDIRNTGAVFVTAGPSVLKSYTLPDDNNWHHLVVVLDRTPSPDTVEAYIDGVSQVSAEDALDGESSAGTDGINIGRGTWASGGYRQGPMDDVRIYNRVLSASEVQQLYQLGR